MPPPTPPPAKVTDWLQLERPPQNVYELLGASLFDPDLELLRHRVRAGMRELLLWQNHPDPLTAQRAARLQHELGRAADLLSSPERLDAHHQQMAQALCSRYAAICDGPPALWDVEPLVEWLRSSGGVHYSAANAAAERIILGSADLPDVILLDEEPEEVPWTLTETIPHQRLIDDYLARRQPPWRRRLSGILFVVVPLVLLLLFLAGVYITSRARFDSEQHKPDQTRSAPSLMRGLQWTR
jgi:hypothetical protein